jgi:L-asparaginase/Glu-tRNA(Gln) amidotransferase subunit D
LNKTIVLTGSQIPISECSNNAEINLIGAFTTYEDKIPEVLLFFNSKLFRGNRIIKQSSTKLDAFDIPNYFPLARLDVFLDFEKHLILDPSRKKTFKYI